jgi:hypothetical protein
VEAFGHAVVSGEAPHQTDLVAPVVLRFAQLGQWREPGLAQLMESLEEAGSQGHALFAAAVLLADPDELFASESEKVDYSQ